MWRSITRLSWWIVTPRELSAMRSSPRFVASARIAPMRTGSSVAAGSPVRKWVKWFANAVQTFRDADPRHEVVEPRGERAGVLPLLASNRRDGEPVRSDSGVGQLVLGRCDRERVQLEIEQRGPLGPPSGEVVWHREPEPALRPHQGEGGPRQKVVVEGAVGAAALHPDVAGAQPVAEMHEYRHLVGAGVKAVGSSPHPLAPAPLQERRRHTIRQLAP